jgi:hypothetical protein
MTGKSPVVVLSSSTTFLTRFIFLSFASISALALVVGWYSGEAVYFIIGIGAALAAVDRHRTYWRLKEIWIDGDVVHASSFRQTVTFPVSDVVSIEARRFRPNTGYMYLKQPTALGDCLVFEPRGWNTVRSSPEVAEAMARAASAGQKADGMLSG